MSPSALDVERCLSELESSVRDYYTTSELSHLFVALVSLRRLRAEYRRSPERVQALVSQVRVSRNQLREALWARREEVAALLRRRDRELQVLKRTADLIRAALAEGFFAANETQWRTAGISVTRKERLGFPDARSENRERLLALIKNSGLWERATAISLPKVESLSRALDVPDDVRRGLVALCHRETSSQIWVRKEKDDDVNRMAIELAVGGATALLTEGELSGLAEDMAVDIAEELLDERMEEARASIDALMDFRRSWNDVLYGDDGNDWEP